MNKNTITILIISTCLLFSCIYPQSTTAKLQVDDKNTQVSNAKDIAKKLNDLNVDLNKVSNTELLLEMGYTYLQADDFDNAEKVFKRRLVLKPNDSRSYSQLAHVYYLKKQYDLSITLYKKALSISPHIGAFRGIAITYWDAGKTEQAIITFKTLIELEPNEPFAYRALGGIYRENRQPDKAIKYFEQSLNLKTPPNTEDFTEGYAYYGLATMYGLNRDYKNAFKYANKWIVLEPNNGQAYLTLGMLYYDLKAYDKAIIVLSKGLSVEPNNQDLKGILKFVIEKSKKSN